MILSEQTNATTLNTLHGVRHSFLSSSSSTCSWVAPLVSPHCLSGLFFVSLLAPLVRWVGPFLLRSGPNFGSSCPASPSFVLFTWVFMSTGASVHRRDRCTGDILPGVCFELSVFCTCVSVRRRDRFTGTALIRFCVSWLVLLHAPPPLLSSFRLCLTQVLRTLLFNCFVCAVLLCLSFASLLVLPCGARVIVLSLCSCGLAVFLGFALLAVLVRALLFPVLSALPLLWFLSLSFLPPLPRG